MGNSKGYSGKYLVYLLIFLGLMSAFGPFVTDMYLPSLPAMAVEFNVSPSEIQGGITASLLGLAIGQIIFGPLSDRTGRKPIMFFSLLLFSLATIGDIFSTSVGLFNIFRFFQGIGGAGGIVLSRSVATDCYSGKELGKTMAIIGAINGVTPVAAPIAGGFIANSFGWQGVFWALFILGVILIGLTLPFSESLEIQHRSKGQLVKNYGNFMLLLRNGQFMKCILIFAVTNGLLFSYISSAPFIVQNVYGYSDTQFSLVFAINACAIILGSGMSVKFRELSHSVLAGGCFAAVSSLIVFMNAIIWHNFWLYEIFVWFSLVGLGFIFPAITTMAMNNGRFAIGAASAVVGAAGFTAGGIISPLSGLGNIVFPSGLAMLCCALFIIIFSKKIR